MVKDQRGKVWHVMVTNKRGVITLDGLGMSRSSIYMKNAWMHSLMRPCSWRLDVQILDASGADDFYGAYNFMAGLDRVSLAWAGGELIMRKGGLLSMEICPSPLKEVPLYGPHPLLALSQ